MFKLALSAGHGKYTAGKRCLKSLDPNETREWVLNSRIADKLESLLKGSCEILRVDDRTGKTDVPLTKRVSSANKWGADLYLSIHHNAGVNGGKGGGIVAFVHTSPSEESVAWQTDFYNALVVDTGLKGNRAVPLAKGNLYEVRATKMPAVLLELGFMDSKSDVPIILSEEYAEKCAQAIARVIRKRKNLPLHIEGKVERPGVLYVDKARQKTENLKGAYTVNAHDGFLNLRSGASTQKPIIEKMDNGTRVRCYGWHTGNWMLVVSESGNAGFCDRKYLKKI